MVEVFYKTKVIEEQLHEKTEYFTLVLAPIPQLFVVIQVHVKWNIDLNEARRGVMVSSCFAFEGDAIREYDKLRAILQGKGFVHAIAAGELLLAPPVVAALKPKRREPIRITSSVRVTRSRISPLTKLQ
jgi:hypothetical protein